MADVVRQTAFERPAFVLAGVGRYTLRVLLLAVALVAYGAVPSTAIASTEYESQQQEEAAGTTASPDLRTKLRGAALRRAEFVLPAFFGQLSAGRHSIPHGADLGPQLSLGLSLPLRC
jgi:hypothetical protein